MKKAKLIITIWLVGSDFLISKNKSKKYLSAVLCVIFLFSLYVLFIDITGGTMKEFHISKGDSFILTQKFPIFLSWASGENGKIIELHHNWNHNKMLFLNKDIQLKTIDKGTAVFKQKVLGLLPYRNIKVNVVPQLKLIPGGHSIGVKLNTEGVLVVGIADIKNTNGKTHNLAEKDGVEIGDSLISIDNEYIINADHVKTIIKGSKGKELTLILERNGKLFKVKTSPIKSLEDDEYRLGLWIRDKTAGVGTMSFFEPRTKTFGALGHGITDVDTGKILSIKDGEIIKSRVISIEEGKRGKPGEIRGVFYDTTNPLGILEKNTNYGVYGELLSELSNDIYKVPLSIAYQHEIREGPAHILTTLESNKIERYEVEVIKINSQMKINGKSMIIKITDHALLNKTGGIIQGMSGSPIIQNNKIIGTVTHVLINDPTRGYGIFIEWMLEESGLFDKYFESAVE
mgnify:CR=1 FL=1